MAVEITGNKEKKVPLLYWVSWVTLQVILLLVMLLLFQLQLLLQHGSYLSFQGNMMNIPFATGETIVSLAAMLLPDWRWLELVLALFCLSTRCGSSYHSCYFCYYN